MENEYNGVETKMHRLDISANGSSSYNKNDKSNKTNDDDSISFQSLIEWELNKRRGRSATYTQPLIHPTNTSIEEEENIVSFLSEFYNYQIYEKCYDMKNILHLYNDTVAIHYNTLVPHTCSFDEFWSRYYYRCSIVQVKKDLLHKQQQQQLEQDEKLVDVPIDDDNDDPVGKTNSNNVNNEIQSSSMLQQSTPTTSNTNTNTNTNRIQMFYQEYDRDIIEVIPEDENENDNDEKDLEQIKL